MTYTTVKHPKSGETYAAEIDDDGKIVGIAGPLHHADPTDEDALDQCLSNNSSTAEDDAGWFRAELMETGKPLT